jgi:uncharacterized Zn finger protein
MTPRRRRRRYDRYDDYGGWGGFAPYVSVAARKAQAKRKLQSLKKSGQNVSPVEIGGRKIATTFWGSAWCDNLERYSDYANRLPRGRTYARNGSVIDLQIGAGRVDALVSGSEVYTVVVNVNRVPASRWRTICTKCAGGIDSLVELLQGRFSKGVMEHLCAQGTGLFPTPSEIEFRCSCPDWASMCKHVAAVLYGVGARLDHRPELLFRLRQVDEQQLIASAGADVALSRKGPAADKVLEDADLAGVFGVELASAAVAPKAPPSSEPPTARRKPVAPRERPAKRATATVVAARPPRSVPKPALKKKPKKRSVTEAARQAVAERMRRYWEERRRR